MRVTNQMMNSTLAGYIMRNQRLTFELQEQISSGQKVTHPSDDPTAFDLITLLTQDEKSLEQFEKNADQLENELLTVDANLQQAVDDLDRISELIVTASNSSIPPEDRETISDEINQILEDLVTLANASPEGRYIYSGLRSDYPAYTVTRDADGKITDVTYEGSTETRQVELSKGSYVSANIPGSDMTGGRLAVFQTEEMDLFTDIIQLRDRLANGENPVEEEEFTVNAATDTLTVNNVYNTGSMVTLESTGTLPGGLDPNTNYYAIVISPTEIQLADSVANARLGVAIDITNTGTGDHAITQQSLAESTRDLEHIMSVLSVIGAREQRVTVSKAVLTQMELDTANDLDDLQSIDVAEAVMELQNRKLAYEAALSVTSSMASISLLNYL